MWVTLSCVSALNTAVQMVIQAKDNCMASLTQSRRVNTSQRR